MSWYTNRLQEAYSALNVKNIGSLKTLPDCMIRLAASALNPDVAEEYTQYLEQLADNSGASKAATGSPNAQVILNQSTALFWFLEFVRLFDRTHRTRKALNLKSAKVVPAKVYEALLRAQMHEIVQEIQSQVRKSELLNFMTIMKHQTKVAQERMPQGQRLVMSGTLLLSPNRLGLEDVFKQLSAVNILPRMLRLPKKGKLDTSSNLIRSNFTPGKWLPYSNFSGESFNQRQNEGQMWIARGRDDAIVIRYRIPMPAVFEYLSATKQKSLTSKLWLATAKL